MESSTWCTRRLGASVAALSEESTVAVTLAKFRPTSCCLSINATPVDGRSSGASSVPETTCCPTAVTSVTDTDSVLRHCHYSPGSVTVSPEHRHHQHHHHHHHHDHVHDHVHAHILHAGPRRIISLSSSVRAPATDQGNFVCCDLCERLRGRSCDYSARTALEDERRGRDHHPRKEERLERGAMTRRGQQRHVLAEHAAEDTSPRIPRRDRPMSDDSSSSYAASVVRWSGSRLERSFRWTRQKKQASAWTILFLLVLVFPASADLQRQTTSRDSTKEEGGESVTNYVWHYLLPSLFRLLVSGDVRGKRKVIFSLRVCVKYQADAYGITLDSTCDEKLRIIETNVTLKKKKKTKDRFSLVLKREASALTATSLVLSFPLLQEDFSHRAASAGKARVFSLSKILKTRTLEEIFFLTPL